MLCMRRTVMTAMAALFTGCVAKCDAPSVPVVGTAPAPPGQPRRALPIPDDGGPNVGGRVIDAETGVGVAGARIVVAGSAGTSGFAGAAGHECAGQTAADGRFEFHNGMGRSWSDSPPHVFVVSANGYVKDSFRMHENSLSLTLRIVRDDSVDVACTGSYLAAFHSIDGHISIARIDRRDLDSQGLRRGERVLAMDGITPDGLGDVGLGLNLARNFARVERLTSHKADYVTYRRA